LEGTALPELHRIERIVLRELKEGETVEVDALAIRTGLPLASIFRATLWLSSRDFVEVVEKKQTSLTLGPEGVRFNKAGFPERILVDTIFDNGGQMPLCQILLLTKQTREELNIALGWAKRKSWIQLTHIDGNLLLSVTQKPKKGLDEQLIEMISSGNVIAEKLATQFHASLKLLLRRPQVIQKSEESERFVSLTSRGLKHARQIDGETNEISQINPELIKSGQWRNVKLRKYNIQSPVERVWPGKKQPFLRFLDELKWKLLALGFTEMKGPLIEFMFFNCDALYMPQDHPAREIHDIYYIKHPAQADLSSYFDYVQKVKATHEDGWRTGSKGWNYRFSIDETKKLILRSQGTALSARMLVDKNLKIPGKYFSISRCYRPDIVDRTHLTEFNQIEGIVISEKLTFRDLLGILKRFASDIAGAQKVRFRPDYFPFTEPSVELAAYRENIGWIEFGGAGIFRPEMTLPLGIKVPVIAWGLGVNRIFMMKSGITDIRDLFTQNLEWLRTQKVI
jgi:phenylalanyl-tRNA synthetase alpha chain